MNPLVAFAVGALTLPALVVLWGLWIFANDRSLVLECPCGYETGVLRETPRWKTHPRWWWHRAAHRLGAKRCAKDASWT